MYFETECILFFHIKANGEIELNILLPSFLLASALLTVNDAAVCDQWALHNNGGFYSAYESVYWGEDFWFILCNYGKTPIDDDYYVNAADVIQANTDYVRVELSEG